MGAKAIILFSIHLILSFGNGFARAPVRFASTARLSKIVSVRGGAGPLNAKNTAKIAAYVLGAQGAYGVLAPTQATEAFGLPNNPIDDFLMKRTSTLIVAIYLLVQEVVFKGVGINKAVGISSIPLVVGVLQARLNGDVSKLGLNSNMEYFLLAFWSLVVYTSLTGSKYADALVKASAVAGLFAGLSFFFFPNENIEFFGAKAQASSTATRVQIRATAVFHLTLAIIVSSLLWGNNVDPLKAVGYGWIPLPLYIIDGLFINKDFVDLRLNQGIQIFWLVLHSIVVATLAF